MDDLTLKEYTDIRYFLAKLHEMETRKHYIDLESGHILYLREEYQDKSRLVYSVRYSTKWIEISHHHFHFLLAMAWQMILDSCQINLGEAQMGWIHKNKISFFIDADPSSPGYAIVADYKNKLRVFIVPKDHRLFNLIENDNHGRYRLRINPQYIRIELSKPRAIEIASPDAFDKKNQSVDY